jgi:hypothetical protein
MLLITSRKIMKYEFAGNAHRSASWMRDGGGGGGDIKKEKKSF